MSNIISVGIPFPDKQIIINYIEYKISFNKGLEEFNEDLKKVAEEGGCSPDAVKKVAAYFANKQIRPIDIANNVSHALQGFQNENEFREFLFAPDGYPSGDEMSKDQLQAAVPTLRERANKVTAVMHPNTKFEEAVARFTWIIDELHHTIYNSGRIPQGEGKFYDYKTQSLNQ